MFHAVIWQGLKVASPEPSYTSTRRDFFDAAAVSNGLQPFFYTAEPGSALSILPQCKNAVACNPAGMLQRFKHVTKGVPK